MDMNGKFETMEKSTKSLPCCLLDCIQQNRGKVTMISDCLPPPPPIKEMALEGSPPTKSWIAQLVE